MNWVAEIYLSVFQYFIFMIINWWPKGQITDNFFSHFFYEIPDEIDKINQRSNMNIDQLCKNGVNEVMGHVIC